jgi:hypothetical protein
MGPTGDDRETALLVDVGGNVGHDINKPLSKVEAQAWLHALFFKIETMWCVWPNVRRT